MSDRSAAPRRALFLDRDGVINVEKNYVHRPEQFEFLPGIFEMCRAAQSCGYALVVVTNQAGIARGYYTEEQFQALTAWMEGRFAAHGVAIAAVYFCPFHPVHGVGSYLRDSDERKPGPGMLLRAARDLGLDLGASVMIGDKCSDMQAAAAAGVPARILLTQDPSADTHCTVPHATARSLDEVRETWFADGDRGTRLLHPSRADGCEDKEIPTTGDAEDTGKGEATTDRRMNADRR